MNYRNIILVAKFLIVATICFSQNQKRRAPKPVTPIVVDSVEYSAPSSDITYIIAKNSESNSIIWKKKIYKISYDTTLEQDVQDVFIDSIKIKKGNLLIRTERGNYYSLDLQTLLLTEIKKDAFIEKHN